MLVFVKFCLTTELDSIVNCHTGYFSSEISGQQRSSCEKIKYVPICTHKKLVQYAFYPSLCPFGRSDSGACLQCHVSEQYKDLNVLHCFS